MINLIHLSGEELFQSISKFQLEELFLGSRLWICCFHQGCSKCAGWQAVVHFPMGSNEHNKEVIWVLRDVPSPIHTVNLASADFSLRDYSGAICALMQTHNENELGFENGGCCAILSLLYTCWILMQMYKKICCIYIVSVYVQNHLTEAIIQCDHSRGNSRRASFISGKFSHSGRQ